MTPQDILRLAGIVQTDQPESHPAMNAEYTADQKEESCCDSVKYALLDFIERYNHESENQQTPNAKRLYLDIVTKLDNIIGHLNSNDIDSAKQLFNQLDTRIKQNIISSDDVLSSFFNCETNNEMTVTIMANEADDECCASVKVPGEIIADIKIAIKELDDGNNYEYISHLSGAADEFQRQQYTREILNTLLNYLTKANETSISNAAIYLTSVSNVYKCCIPQSVWKFLAVDYHKGNSIKDKLNMVKNKLVVKPITINSMDTKQ
jgi:hypothetical protein